MTRMGYGFLGGRSKSTICHIILSVHVTDAGLNHLAEVEFVMFLHCKHLGKKITMFTPHLRLESYASLFEGRTCRLHEIVCKLLKILLHGRFVSPILINVFTFLFIPYRLMDVYCIL